MSLLRFIAGAAFATATISDAATNFSVDAHVLSSGASVQGVSPCFRLNATIAEAAPGYASSATSAVSAGFRYASLSPGGDEIFFGGFEGCIP